MITSLSQLDPDGSYTYADYQAWKFQERVELLRGKWHQLHTPLRRHQQILMQFCRYIANHVWRSKYEVYAAPFDVRLIPADDDKAITTVVQPDLCVICDPTKLDDKGCIGAPDLIIEILSPGNSRLEMKEKFELYQEAGVLEYWVVSPIENMVQVWKLTDEGYYIGLPPKVEGDLLTTPILPGLNIDLTEVFEP